MRNGMPDGSSEWEKKIHAEAENFVKAVQQNFIYGLKITRPMLPKADKNCLLAQLNVFIDALCAVNVQIATSFINPAVEIEDNIVAAIREKFKSVREQIAAKNEAEKLGLINAKGEPLTKENANSVLAIPDIAMPGDAQV